MPDTIYRGSDWRFERELPDSTIEVMQLSHSFLLLAPSGFGQPATEWQTQRALQGVGERVLGYQIGVRNITLEIASLENTSMTELNIAKRRLIEFAKPNQHKPIYVVVTQEDGSKFASYLRPLEGASFTGGSQDGVSFREPTSWVAHDPIIFNPAKVVYNLPLDDLGEADEDDIEREKFVFPITFPITFGIKGVPFITPDLKYPGSWRTRPKITLTGPYAGARVRNTATGRRFQFDIGIGEGAMRIIEWDSDAQNWIIVDGDGNNVWNELTPKSNLLDFAIMPDNEISGRQKIEITFSGRNDDTAATVEYYERYIGT